MIALVAALVVSACGGDDPQAEAGAPDEQADVASADAATVEAGTPEEAAAILIGCESTVADGVPAFYSSYFRCTDIALDGDHVVITGTNLPPHLSYYYGEDNAQFEAFDFSRSDEYRPNPNQIAEQMFVIRVPIDPVATGVTIDEDTVNLDTGDATDYPFGAAGVALDGVALFNPLAAPGDDIEDERFTFDSNEGHPQQQGAYHYHAVAIGPLAVLQSLGLSTSMTPGEAEIELYGVMCDGTVALGAAELDGSAVETELDLQAGHVHDLVDGAGTVLLEDRYHVHMAPSIGVEPRGLTPEAQYYSTCDVTAR